MSRRKLTPNQEAYRKQLRRIKNAYKSVEKQGFTIPYNLIPETPKRITQKAIQELKSITPRYLRSKSTEYMNLLTGEISEKPPKNFFQIAREYYKSNKSNTLTIYQNDKLIIDNFRDLIRGYVYFTGRRGNLKTDVYNYVNNWLNQLLQLYGEHRVASMLQEGYQNGQWLSPREAYDPVLLSNSLNTMVSYLGLSKEQISELWNMIDY